MALPMESELDLVTVLPGDTGSPRTEDEEKGPSFEALYSQVAELLHRLQTAHQQEMLRGARARKLKPKTKGALGRGKLKARAAPPLESNLDEEEDKQEQDKLKEPRHSHIGCPSEHPICLEKLHKMVQAPNAPEKRQGTLEGIDGFLSEHVPVYKQAKSMMGIQQEVEVPEEAKPAQADKSCRAELGDFVEGWWFKFICHLVIIANAVHLALLSDWQMKMSYDAALNGGQEVQDVHFLDFFFASWFVVEMVLRIIPSKGPVDFFTVVEGHRWNCFDTLIAVEAVFGLIIRLSVTSFSHFRVLGIFRLARLVKPMKRIKVFRKLRKTLLALVASLADLLWAFLVVILFLYMYSVFLSTATVTYFNNFNRTSDLHGEELAEVQKVQDYYGSIISTMLSLWSAISGGNDWMEYAETLRTMGGVGYYVTFILFIAFCTIGLFNVVTGIFVDSAVEAANMFRSDAEMIADHQERKKEEEDELAELKIILGDDAGKIVRYHELEKHLKDSKAQAFWQSKMQLNVDQVKDMFKLYERLMPRPKTDPADGSKKAVDVEVESFLDFTRKCKGPASYVDLLTLMHDQTRLGKFIQQEFQDVKSHLAFMGPPLPPPRAPPARAPQL